MKTLRTLAMLLAVIGLATAAHAIEPTVITFDDGTEGWDANPDCETLPGDDGNPGAYWNFASRECDGPWVKRSWFDVRTSTNPAFIGDYTAKGPVRVSVDIDVNLYEYVDFLGNAVAVEEYRQLVVEFIDHDNPYTDPDTGYSWPWTSVMFPAGYFQSRDDGWQTFNIDIVDPNATEVPEGWVGFGGPENPDTYMPQLPPGVTFADVMAGVDELVMHTIEPGYFYAISFLHDINVDNLSIEELPKSCAGLDATIFVDGDNIVHGGPYDGMTYAGELPGSKLDDVIVGTPGADLITGHWGNDIICGGDGDDEINGQAGDDFILGQDGDDTLIGQDGGDFIDGGPGRDVINGGRGADTCTAGEVVNQCDPVMRGGRVYQESSRPTVRERDTRSREATGSVAKERY